MRKASYGNSGRGTIIGLLFLGLSMLLVTVEPTAKAEAPAWPNSMAALGDSVTRAFNTKSFLQDTPGNSWSTGTYKSTDPNFLSQYSHILAQNYTIKGNSYNDAATGSKVADLFNQAQTAIAQNVDYVTILSGANDLCGGEPQAPTYGMTDPEIFRQQFEAALTKLTSELPNVKIYVVSIPNIYRLWETFHEDRTAVATWNLLNLVLKSACPALLKNPTSMDNADVQRREAVNYRTLVYNLILNYVCTNEFPDNCLFDNYAIYNAPFTASDISTLDYFHPSQTGQARLACESWNYSYWKPDEPVKCY